MISDKQVETASGLLLQEGRLAQAAQADATSRRHRGLLAFKWMCIGAMLGYSVDELVSHRFAGQPAAWVILCMALMLAVIVARQMREG